MPRDVLNEMKREMEEATREKPAILPILRIIIEDTKRTLAKMMEANATDILLWYKLAVHELIEENSDRIIPFSKWVEKLGLNEKDLSEIMVEHETKGCCCIDGRASRQGCNFFAGGLPVLESRETREIIAEATVRNMMVTGQKIYTIHTHQNCAAMKIAFMKQNMNKSPTEEELMEFINQQVEEETQILNEAVEKLKLAEKVDYEITIKHEHDEVIPSDRHVETGIILDVSSNGRAILGGEWWQTFNTNLIHSNDQNHTKTLLETVISQIRVALIVATGGHSLPRYMKEQGITEVPYENSRDHHSLRFPITIVANSPESLETAKELLGIIQKLFGENGAEHIIDIEPFILYLPLI